MTIQITDKTSLKLAKLLLQKKYTKEEILNKLNIKNSTFYKYIHIFKQVGFEIIRENNIYKIKNFKNAIKMADFEKSLLAYLCSLSFYMLPFSKTKIFLKLIENMLSMTTYDDSIKTFESFEQLKTSIMNKDYRDKINLLQKYIDTQTIIDITTASKKILTITPIDFKWQKEKVYLYYFDSIKFKKSTILLSNIIKISYAGGWENTKHSKETIYELYGKLAKSYLLKDDERIIDKFKDKIIIGNSSTDKTTLYKRLLRYDSCCKILFPKTDVLEFQNLIKNSLDNIK